MSATQKEIAEVFRRRVDEVGYTRATLDDVARSLKMSKKTIYVHFDGKREIYAYIVERQAAQEKARLAAMLAALPTCAARRGGGGAHRASTWGGATWRRPGARSGSRSTRSPRTRSARPTATSSASSCRPAWTPASSRRATRALVEQMVTAMVIEYLLLVREDPSYDRDEELLARIIRFIG